MVGNTNGRHSKPMMAIYPKVVFGAFVVAYGRMRVGVYEWSAGEIETLFSLNAFAVASLMGFVAVRYAGVERR